MAKATGTLLTLTLIALGLVIMVTPLALWVAWTEVILFAVLAAFTAAAGLYCVLVRYEKPDHRGDGEHAAHARPGPLPDEAVAELQALHPFIHHHRPSNGAAFRAAMDKVKRLLYRD